MATQNPATDHDDYVYIEGQPVKYDDRPNLITVCFHLARNICEISGFEITHPDVQYRIGFRKNHSMDCTFVNLRYGITIQRVIENVDKSKEVKEVVYSNEWQGPEKSNEAFLTDFNIKNLEPGENYDMLFWCNEENEVINDTLNITIGIDDDTPDTFTPPKTQQVTYHSGYIPDDEQWERDQPFLPEGYTRPT